MPAATAGRGPTQFGRSWRVLGTAHAAADVLRWENSGLTTIGSHRERMRSTLPSPASRVGRRIDERMYVRISFFASDFVSSRSRSR